MVWWMYGQSIRDKVKYYIIRESVEITHKEEYCENFNNSKEFVDSFKQTKKI